MAVPMRIARQNPRGGANTIGGMPNQRIPGGRPGPGYGGGRLIGGPAPNPLPGPPPMREARPPRPELGGAFELPEMEPVPDFLGLPPGQAKKSGLPFGWHYNANNEPMRNVEGGAGAPAGRGGFRQPSRGGRVRTSRGRTRKRGVSGYGGGAALS